MTILRIASCKGWKNDETINGVITIGERLTLIDATEKIQSKILEWNGAYENGLE